jgi:hypothetical protein
MHPQAIDPGHKARADTARQRGIVERPQFGYPFPPRIAW